MQIYLATYPFRDIWVLCLLTIGIVLWNIFLCRSHTVSLSVLDIVTISFGVIVAISSFINHSYGSGPITALSGILYLLLYFIARTTNLLQVLTSAILTSALLQSCIAYGQLFGWIHPINTYFPFTGSFDNPAPLGCLIVLGFLVCLSRILQRPKNITYYILGGILTVAIILSQSRAAWIAWIVGCCIICAQIIAKFRFNEYRRIALLVLGIFFIGGLYILRPDSATGRLLIWRVSSRLMFEKPLIGHGAGSFEVSYPLAQANYFRTYPDSHFTYLADDISSPFNELLSIGVQFGLLGLAGFCSAVWITMKYSIDNLQRALLVSLILFGMFSYPFYYPVFMIIGACLIGSCPIKEKWKIPYAMPITICGIIIGGIGAYSYLLQQKAPITNRYNKYYLGELANIHFHRRHYDSLADIFNRIPSSTLGTDIAKGYIYRQEYDKAKQFALLSSNMVPNRVMPKYLLFRIYDFQKERDSAEFYAREILRMNHKVINTTVLKAKHEAAEYINNSPDSQY